jgi:hypothetical protein
VSTYKPNHKDFAAFMMSRQIAKPVEEIAEAVKGVAIPLTPEKTGAMRSKYEVSEIAPVVINGSPRRTFEVRNADPAAPAVEFGGKRNKAIRPLGRAAALFGDGSPG